MKNGASSGSGSTTPPPRTWVPFLASSVRCSEKGYWNRFVPILDFSSAKAYAKSIARYVQDGLLAAPSELYYPIRLKPRGLNNLLTLAERGIDHIEIRCVDLNPLTGGLVDVRDVEFVHLFMLWCAAQGRETLSAAKQEESVGWFKAAARLDFDWSAVGELLERSLRDPLRIRESLQSYRYRWGVQLHHEPAGQRDGSQHRGGCGSQRSRRTLPLRSGIREP